MWKLRMLNNVHMSARRSGPVPYCSLHLWGNKGEELAKQGKPAGQQKSGGTTNTLSWRVTNARLRWHFINIKECSRIAFQRLLFGIKSLSCILSPCLSFLHVGTEVKFTLIYSVDIKWEGGWHDKPPSFDCNVIFARSKPLNIKWRGKWHLAPPFI